MAGPARATHPLLGWLILPVVIAAAGVLWIDRATTHFEVRTGRAFYGLAGYHHSVPERGFAYHEGGEAIRRWTTIIPGSTTVTALLLSAVIAVVRGRRTGGRGVAAVAAAHGSVVAAILFVVAYYDIHVTGVFL